MKTKFQKLSDRIIHKVRKGILKKRRVKNHYVPEFITKTCCVCFSEKEALVGTDGNTLPLCKLDHRHVEEYSLENEKLGRLRGDVLVSMPCEIACHEACVDCLRTTLLNFQNHPVTVDRPNVFCLFPFGSSCPGHYVNLQDFSFILDTKEWKSLTEYVAEKSGHTSVTCECGHTVTLDSLMKDSSLCSQCGITWCAYCRKKCRGKECPECLFSLEKWNRRYRDPVTGKLRRQKDVVTVPVPDHSLELPPHELKKDTDHDNSDEEYIKVPTVICPGCGVHMERTTACSELSHCKGWKVCWMCGYAAGEIPADHWKQCPRWDGDPKLREKGYLCNEGTCYDHEHTCAIPDHRPGIQKYHEFRRRIMSD